MAAKGAANIFISYRRDDSDAYAKLIRDRLADEFDRDQIFMDVDSIPLGEDFVAKLRDSLRKTNILLAIIDPHWLDARDKEGRRRLEQDGDHVRREIATALASGIQTVPIVLGKAQMPKADRLPDDLKSLSRCNALFVHSPESIATDLDKLIKQIRSAEIKVQEPTQASDAAQWPAFRAETLNCLVVESEYESSKETSRKLVDIVGEALLDGHEIIWRPFLAACSGRMLASGQLRRLPEIAEPPIPYRFSVFDALASAAHLDNAARAVVQADLVLFDVTGFEPGIMLLIGIRAACRRGITICSYGAGWEEGNPLEIPFNLQNLNINSHTWKHDGTAVERLIRRIETGFEQLATHPVYLDLPAYDALRQLGPRLEASATIDPDKRVLVLCSYSTDFFRNWDKVRFWLKQSLAKKTRRAPREVAPARPQGGRLETPYAVERIVDYRSPQLIWQCLFEQIRRTAACVVDWTEYSPSVFMELGVRLAVSEWGAVQIVDRRYLPGSALAAAEQQELDDIDSREFLPDAGEQATDPGESLPSPRRKLAQVEHLAKLFKPLVYRRDDPSSAALDTVVDDLLQRQQKPSDYNRIHWGLQPVIETIQEVQSPVHTQLKNMADALHHPDQDRQAVSPIIFYQSPGTKRDSKKSALEMRIAAWLYLEHRKGLDKLANDPEREAYDDLARAAKDALYDLINEKSIDADEYQNTLAFAKRIEEGIEKIGFAPNLDLFGQVKRLQADARSCRKKGEALQTAANVDGAQMAFDSGVSILRQAIDELTAEAPQIAVAAETLDERSRRVVDELIETYGAQGGLLQRGGSLPDAALSYSQGAELERKFAHPSTYNRLNEVKCSLRAGTKPLRDLRDGIESLAEQIKRSLVSGKNSADSGWAWADLGDCLALLGREKEALEAYATFIAKAELKSLKRTSEILQEIAPNLKDEKHERLLRSVIQNLQNWLAGKKPGNSEPKPAPRRKPPAEGRQGLGVRP
jgi:tetratricopeptide (TPR) repeat protein